MSVSWKSAGRSHRRRCAASSSRLRAAAGGTGGAAPVWTSPSRLDSPERTVSATASSSPRLAELARAHGGGHRVVGVQQPLSHPAAARHARERLLDHLRKGSDGLLDSGGLLREAERRGARPARRDAVRGVEQPVDADPRAGRASHHRDAELPLEPRRVDRDAVAPGLVHQIHVDHHPVGDVEDLQHEVQVALEAGGVDHRHRHVGPPEQDELARHLFVGAARLQRIGAGQVDDLHARAAVRERSLGADDGLAGPVPGVLPESGQGVEDGALADVRVAGEGDEDVPLVGAQPQPDQTLRPVLGAAAARRGRQRHQATSSTSCAGTALSPAAARSTWIQAACVRRSAISAPRMR